MDAAQEEKESILKVIDSLKGEFPELSDVLERVGDLTNIKIPILD